MKDTVRAYENPFWSVSRLVLEGIPWNVKCFTFRACAVNNVRLVVIG